MVHGRRNGACLLVAMLALVTSACSDTASPLPGTASTSPPASGSTKPASSTQATRAPKGWKTFAYQTIAFAYPPLPGTVRVASDGESGPRHAWTIRRSDTCDPLGHCRTYEFAAVNDGCPGTEGWPTFAHRWIQIGGKDLLSTCQGKDPFQIEPIRVVRRPDGLKGVIYDANEWFTSKQDVKIEGALAAVLNFPNGFHKNFKAIAFYFEDPVPLVTVETVLRLVKLTA